MPIIAKSIIEARRAAAAAAARAAAAQVHNVAPAEPLTSPVPHARGAAGDQKPRTDQIEAAPARPSAKRRGHAVKDERGKWQPTGDYESGFARAPVDTRFRPGCKGGPGRPKGSVSHDALLAKHLRQKREVSINGRRQQLTTREMLVMTTVKSAVEGKDKHARAYLLAQDQRLHPSKENGDDAANGPAVTASDLLSFQEFEAELRETLRAEIRAELEAEREERR